MEYRIIYINANPIAGQKILCEVSIIFITMKINLVFLLHTKASYRKLFAPKYVWILPLWYNDSFWHIYDNSSCNDKIMIQVLNGTIETAPGKYFPMEGNTVVQTFSGIVS